VEQHEAEIVPVGCVRVRVGGSFCIESAHEHHPAVEKKIARLREQFGSDFHGQFTHAFHHKNGEDFMLTIHTEITIEMGDFSEHPITLWVVSYGPPSKKQLKKDLPAVLNVLRRSCANQGWLMESEHDDTYRNENPNVFSQGFLWPQDDEDKA
jgi:hypothetical protein